jgi:hypothetical protein
MRLKVSLLLSFSVIALGFRIAVVHWWPNDTPDDGRVYAQMARNMLEQHVFSHDTQAPYEPSLIRLPGYPLFLASIYSVFGHTNNGAVRMVQALIDTGTCGLIALLAFYWQPDKEKKITSALAALALAALCPFTTIYAATILTEVPTMFLMMAMFVAATLGLNRILTTEDTEEEKSRQVRKAIVWWVVAGLIGGLNVLFRPDSGLFVAAVGFTLLITAFRVPTLVELFGRAKNPAEAGTLNTSKARFSKIIARALLAGSVFSLAFAVVLVPWTIRNWRVFHKFQPLSPAHGEMPGEFVPRGYELWLRTWLDDQSYVAPFLWSLDTEPIEMDQVPPYAFDSDSEKLRVATLLEAYNNRRDTEADDSTSEAPQTAASPTPQPSPSASPSTNRNQPATNQTRTQPTPSEQSDEDESDSEDQEDESSSTEKADVEMTPEIDEAFGRLARERIARHPFKFYIWLPLKRGHTMWFDTHSQYWPFEGTLLPFEDLDYDHHQQYWLPLFAALTGIFTLLGVAGMWVLWSSGELTAPYVLLMTVLAMLFRLALFSWIENPEPRYLVEFFPLLSVLGGIAIAKFMPRRKAEKGKEQRAKS